MNLSNLEKLHAAVESLLQQESFSRTVERLRLELSGSQEPFVWSTVALNAISLPLPAPIKSCWIFLLKRARQKRTFLSSASLLLIVERAKSSPALSNVGAKFFASHRKIKRS